MRGCPPRCTGVNWEVGQAGQEGEAGQSRVAQRVSAATQRQNSSRCQPMQACPCSNGGKPGVCMWGDAFFPQLHRLPGPARQAELT